MGIFDRLCGSPAEDPSVMKVRNILQNITEGIRMRFSCQVLPPEIILGEKWKTGNQTETGVVDLVRLDNDWTIEEFERLLNANKVYVCSVHVRIDMESPDDNIVSPTYGHWGDWRRPFDQRGCCDLEFAGEFGGYGENEKALVQDGSHGRGRLRLYEA